ncbi:putative reverse transcriptase-like protein [Arabidopsis thaliana]|uniref:F11O4.8 n=1 Tax=Arabidopsis thaliana TaxID=3702 RepID=O82592_ARATH|nr:F11O4.8 [Arabidopsis thaliana]CAB77723.1 putative reverse transcriptase-like protein [Arabidopsis thaliana]
MLARVLKGRYFKNIHPLQTKKINSPSFRWRTDIPIIRGLFISQSYKSDRLIWHHTKSERYTVKTPPKIKHFLWQIASGFLAVTSKLSHRGIQCDITCKMCEMADETINNVLFECSHSRKICELSKIPMVSDIGGEKTYCYAWILWFIWKDMNKKVFKGIQSESADILNHAMSEKLMWEEAQLEPIDSTTITGSLDSPTQSVRCQFDGSWKSLDPNMGLGWWCFQENDQMILFGAKGVRK